MVREYENAMRMQEYHTNTIQNSKKITWQKICGFKEDVS